AEDERHRLTFGERPGCLLRADLDPAREPADVRVRAGRARVRTAEVPSPAVAWARGRTVAVAGAELGIFGCAGAPDVPSGVTRRREVLVVAFARRRGGAGGGTGRAQRAIGRAPPAGPSARLAAGVAALRRVRRIAADAVGVGARPAQGLVLPHAEVRRREVD